MKRLSSSLVAPLTFVVAIGCAGSEPITFTGSGGEGGDAGTNGAAGAGPGGTNGAAGAAGTTAVAGSGGGGADGRGGMTGAAGTSGRGGATGGAGSSGRGGATGAGGRGGTTGTGGRGGTTGSAGTGAGANPDGGTATFTQVYSQVVSMYCFGSGCHNPPGGGRPDFSTKTSCYTYFKNQGQLYGGQDPQKSYIYSIMHGDPSASPPSPPYMPPDPNPKVSDAGLATVAAWIAGGAQNN
jgi:hypothetical protein